MPRMDPGEFVRHFRENGLKVLFEDAGNVRDLLTLRDPERAARIDFSRLRIDRTTYVAADYRHLASDIVLKVPYRTRLGGRRRTLTLYILIEHQSEPDVLMVLRVLEYLVQVYKGQVRTRKPGGRTPKKFRLRPVLPIVLYTGERDWEALTGLAELIEGGDEDFAEVVPRLRPLFLNLSAIPTAELESAGGFLGWVLELLRLRNAPPEEYGAATGRVVEHLTQLVPAERKRWLLLLSYLDAMIYHDRALTEWEQLHEVIVKSVRTDPLRREVEAVMQTIADALRDQGREEGREEGQKAEGLRSRQQTLVRLLRLRFGRVPRPVEQVVRATNDVTRLDAWLDNFATAQTLADVGIAAEQDQ